MGPRVDDELRNVYVVEIDSKWVPIVRPKLDPSVTLLYVGQTKKPPSKRVKEHRRGYRPKDNPGRAAANIFRDIHQARLDLDMPGTLVKFKDARIRWDLMAPLEPVGGRKAAEILEIRTANDLRAKGFQVEGPGKPKRKKGRKSGRAKG